MPTVVRHSLLVLGLTLAVLLPRVLDLDTFLTADEKRWEANTAGFLRNLSTGDWGHLLQQPHPGVTQQWLGAVGVLAESWTARKIPLVLGQSVLVGIIGYVFFRLWGGPPATLLVLLLALNPVLVAHTRIYAMDALLGLTLLLSLGLLLLWKETKATRYLIASGVAGALAVLSKLPGIIIVPFSLGALLLWHLRTPRESLRPLIVWMASFLVTLPVVLPSLLVSPVPVIGHILEFFGTDEYRETHHGGRFFYLATLAFSSTPLQLFSLVVFPFVALAKNFQPRRLRREHAVLFLLFAVLFLEEMSIGAKKGDRYILPIFLSLDVLAVAVVSWAQSSSFSRAFKRVAIVAVGGAVLWQGFTLWRLHPYALAYVNPLTRSALGDRRMGWGEGLDLAAAYLNAKPDAARLKVASWYPYEFGRNFVGEVVPVNHYDNDSVNYVVLYRGMLERGADAWETDLVETFRRQTPEHIIRLNGIDYAWIYPRVAGTSNAPAGGPALEP